MGASYKDTFKSMGEGYQNTAGILSGKFDPSEDPFLKAIGMKKSEADKSTQRMAGEAQQTETGLTASPEFMDPIKLQVILARKFGQQ